MAKYRTYKNGIYGHKYKGYYIIKGESKGKFQIQDESAKVVKDNIFDYTDSEWAIDKLTATPEDMNMILSLYEMEIFRISSLFVELMQKKADGSIDEKGEALFEWAEKVRKRKAEDREM